ncbi:MAG TPA: polysaccharide biosynthesis tyrosine autokinase [Gemmatimonadaceae bacterium]|nr:polysaccharide biosynthesis tyrosine autokinase [Gemmatimonadaceae bacterium]
MTIPDRLPDVASESVHYEPENRAQALRNAYIAVRHRWWAVVGVFLLVVSVTMWRTVQKPRQYRATATVRIGEVQAPISGLQTPVYRDYRVDPIQSEQIVIKSEAVASEAADMLGLRLQIVQPPNVHRHLVFGPTPPKVDSSAQVAGYTLDLREAVYALRREGQVLGTARYGDQLSAGGITLSLLERPRVPEREIALQVISERAAAGIVRGPIVTRGLPLTNIVEISFTGTDPTLVKETANAVALAYREFSARDRLERARNRTQFIAQQLEAQRGQLQTAQDALKAFKEGAQLSNVNAEQTALVASIHNFEGQLDGSRVKQRVYERLIGRLEAADTATDELRRLAGTEAVQENQYISNLYTRWFDLVKQREELLSQNKTSAHDDVKAVDRLISRTKEDLREASGLYLKGLQSRIESLQSTIASLRGETERYPSLEAQETRLLGDMKSVQAVYDQLQAELQRSRIAERDEDASVRLIDEAQQPTVPIAPNRRRIFFTSVIFGLLLGLGAAILLENLDDSVKSPEEMQSGLGLTVLGTIPRIRAATNGRDSDRSVEERLVTHVDPRSPVAEAYRSLRTNLAFARVEQEVRTIVLTSPGPADGKSTTVANLAITFAQQGQRTLLIDADLRRAVIDKLFDVPRSPGLTDVLVGEAMLADAVREAAIPNLAVIGSGRFPPNPAELLGSTAMRDVLRECSAEFDIVLLDSPPLLAVTDAAVLATMTDGAILIVRVGSTPKAATRRAMMQLQTVRARILGSVLNDVDFRQGAFAGGYGYYYYYYYGQDGSRNGHGTARAIANRLLRLVTTRTRSSDD